MLVRLTGKRGSPPCPPEGGREAESFNYQTSIPKPETVKTKNIFKMKTKKKLFSFAGIGLLAVVFALASCSKTDDGSDVYLNESDREGFAYAMGGDGDSSGAGGGDNPGEGTDLGNTQAGVVTAGEWCDLTNWDFWSKLMLGEEYSNMAEYWQLYTNNRVAVKVTDEHGNAMAGVKVKLLREGDGTSTVWETVTDNHGMAECWLGLLQQSDGKADRLRVSLNGEMMDGHPAICPMDSLLQSVTVNEYVCKKSSSVSQQADIAFIVDATGSMSDEIDFLKEDLMDIIRRVESVRPSMKMRTAALFYRDEGDEYLTRHHDFTTNLSQTVSFVEQQRAEGGGDYPEAVHTALDRMLQDLSWDSQARTRIAFLVLDAPAHHEDAVIHSLQKSVEQCAKQGIRLIPVAASGVDKNTEFMLRFFAVSTGGTYVFITDDSGVGNSHLVASVGDYKVEQLNNLIIRLIEYYTE